MKAIQLTNGGQTLVDDADYEWLSQYSWQVVTDYRGYTRVRGHVKGKTVYMHRVILGVTDPSIKIDHEDRDALNNQRYNLRTCTVRQNQFNTVAHKDAVSKFKGVTYRKTKRCGRDWKVYMKINGVFKYVGCYSSEVEAARAYNELAIVHHGEYVRLNEV